MHYSIIKDCIETECLCSRGRGRSPSIWSTHCKDCHLDPASANIRPAPWDSRSRPRECTTCRGRCGRSPQAWLPSQSERVHSWKSSIGKVLHFSIGKSGSVRCLVLQIRYQSRMVDQSQVWYHSAIQAPQASYGFKITYHLTIRGSNRCRSRP